MSVIEKKQAAMYAALDAKCFGKAAREANGIKKIIEHVKSLYGAKLTAVYGDKFDEYTWEADRVLLLVG